MDAGYKVHLYDLHQQAALTSPGLWDTFTALACPLRKNKVRVSFFSATARGGGVALMRHSLMRIWRKSIPLNLAVGAVVESFRRPNGSRYQVVRAARRLGSFRHYEEEVPQRTSRSCASRHVYPQSRKGALRTMDGVELQQILEDR